MDPPLSNSSKINAPFDSIDSYYVRKQAKQIISDYSQMTTKGEKKSLNFVRQHEDVNDNIEKEMQHSKKKIKTWKQLDTYLKWQAIEKYLKENNLEGENKINFYKLEFQKLNMPDVLFDSKTQSVIKLNFNGV